MSNARDRETPDMNISLNDYSKSVNLVSFINSRRFEMKVLKNTMDNKQSSKRVFQLLPNFLRRRGASYNSNKLPLRLRKLGKSELIKENRKPRKRSKRLKLRYCSLKRDYQRRQKNGKWLETHLWHAKRSKMMTLWNHKLCLSPNAGGKRSGYRLHKERCNIVDTSYIGVIELIGEREQIVRLLEKFIDQESNPFGGKRYTNGKRQGTSYIYAIDSFPQHFFGPIDFLWNSSSEDKLGQLWLFVHPSFYSQFFQQLNQAIHNTSNFNNIQINDLKNELCHFTLYGPKALQTLHRGFKICSQSLEFPNSNLIDTAQIWNNLILAVRSQSSLPTQAVLSLNIFDPRLSVIKKLQSYEESLKTQREQLNDTNSDLITQLLIDWPLELSSSALWNPEIRNNVKNRKLTDSIINQRRSQTLIPGQNIQPNEKDVQIPILLINQTNSNGQSQSIRHDALRIILPSGWGSILWNRLVFCGARHQGLQYLRQVANFGARNLYFPLDFPSSEAYRELLDKMKNSLKEKYDRTPPAKRINYSELNIKYPFGIDFDQFIWDKVGADSHQFPPCLLFTRSRISQLQHLVLSPQSNNINAELENWLKPLYLSSKNRYSELNYLTFLKTCLVPIICNIDSKGLCNDYSIIYQVSSETQYTEHSSHPLPIQQQKHLIPSDSSILGYITSGGFCPQSGKGVGIGWIQLDQLIGYIQNHEQFTKPKKSKILEIPVLIRNPTSYTCRVATATLLGV